ncbi:hypothetical protein TNCV_2140661 [Trichonephila clavipes]|uniref:Endonuclease-reverse transcriptase n=1 Tax=Trichonephila clavipes TaxID=2585209 RepID=A0A8X6S0F0_TRICX|nr:hypothetical protein TNCV_2140661 [Trichonephila clavipes]
MRWVGHIVRMSLERAALKIFKATSSNKRPKGRRWKDCVDEDFAILKVKNWRSISGRRAEWERLLRKVETHKGLSCQY